MTMYPVHPRDDHCVVLHVDTPLQARRRDDAASWSDDAEMMHAGQKNALMALNSVGNATTSLPFNRSMIAAQSVSPT